MGLSYVLCIVVTLFKTLFWPPPHLFRFLFTPLPVLLSVFEETKRSDNTSLAIVRSRAHDLKEQGLDDAGLVRHGEAGRVHLRTDGMLERRLHLAPVDYSTQADLDGRQ